MIKTNNRQVLPSAEYTKVKAAHLKKPISSSMDEISIIEISEKTAFHMFPTTKIASFNPTNPNNKATDAEIIV
jgi:hypothetical protein